MSERGEIIIYQSPEGETELKVNIRDDTVWLSQKQMAELFDKDVRTINDHIENVYTEKELEPNSTIRKFRIVQKEGKREVQREVEHYNLDVVISIGYRVKSKQGIQFRIWANKIIKNYLIQGYAINEKRLEEQQSKLKDLQNLTQFIADKSNQPELLGETEKLLSLINDYTRSITLLKQYDEGEIQLSAVKKPEFIIDYKNARQFIDAIKTKLADDATNIFGQEYHEKFKGILGSIYQTFDSIDLYPTVEEKSANLLYLIIKDHPFVDGNKRIGSLLFIYFLDKNNFLFDKNGYRKITDNTLTALALLIAASNPKEKDIMINIITSLLN